MGKQVIVEIFGNKYTLDTDRDINEATRIAGYVDAKMKEMREKFPYTSPISLAILAALNIADDLYTLQKKIEELEEML
ncbi:cell division protein ZapA [candidate division WOR-3 bacterium]|nr:cell division protein ZapA [candidate division WOR-3 bacterium]